MGKRALPDKLCQYQEEEILEEILNQYEVNKTCCDLGARLKGSNTANLVRNHGFKGVFVEANPRNAAQIKQYFPDETLIADFVTPFNVNDLVPDDCGVLSLDIDGNDFWVWGMLNKTPQVVIIEFGLRAKWWMIGNYDPESKKRKDVTSKTIMALLAKNKGYRFYKETGVNLVFIHNELPLRS